MTWGGTRVEDDVHGYHDLTEGYCQGHVPTPKDLCMRDFYGNWVHTNDLSHLDGGGYGKIYWKS